MCSNWTTGKASYSLRYKCVDNVKQFHRHATGAASIGVQTSLLIAPTEDSQCMYFPHSKPIFLHCLHHIIYASSTVFRASFSSAIVTIQKQVEIGCKPPPPFAANFNNVQTCSFDQISGRGDDSQRFKCLISGKKRAHCTSSLAQQVEGGKK